VPPEHFSAGNYLKSDIGGGSLHSHFLNYDLHHAASFMLSFSFASQISQLEGGFSRISLQFALYQNCQLIPESYRGAYWGLLVLSLTDKYTTVSWRYSASAKKHPSMPLCHPPLHSTPLCCAPLPQPCQPFVAFLAVHVAPCDDDFLFGMGPRETWQLQAIQALKN
jgi:hypothetical protein